MKIKILNKPIDIKFVDKVEDDENTLGEWVHADSTIYIKKNEPMPGEVILHELLECIRDNCDIKMSHQSLSTLSCILYSVLSEYPDILNVKE